METDLYELHPQTYNWTAIVLSKKTVKSIRPGDLIRKPQRNSKTGWSSYSVIINVFEESGDVQSYSTFYRSGQQVQVTRPHP
jgi:hypothetical protein